MIPDYIKQSPLSICNLISCSHLTLEKFRIEEGSLDYWEMIIVCNGSFSCKIGNTTETLKSGDIFFLPVSQKFQRIIHEKLDIYLVRFMPDERKFVALKMPVGKIEFINTERIQNSINILKNIHRELFDGYRDAQQHIIDDILYQYYFEHRTKTFNKPQIARDRTVHRITNYFCAHLSENIKIIEIAEKFGITTAGLILKFKKNTGLSPSNYLILLRMELARKLLLQSTLSITEIAVKCGYENTFYFSNAFKKHNNMTPTFYRKTFLI